MAKKRFTQDLGGLFEEESVEVSVPVATPAARKKLSSKGFTQDLDAFLSDSFEQSPAPQPTPTPRSRRRRTGLDYLIRSTVSTEEQEKAPRGNTAETKRVTLIFNKEHLAELKEQAKERNMYLKDVVQEMVANYLER